jgi:predicted DNA-binding protein (MmcQ/YjbR family)
MVGELVCNYSLKIRTTQPAIKNMTVEEIQSITKKLQHVTEDIKWEDHLCFNVGGKMFLVTAPDRHPVSASIKVSDEEFGTLTQREGIIPAPYLARHKWVYLDDINRLKKKEWNKYIIEAYCLVGSKLPAKIRKQLGLSNSTDGTKKPSIPKSK